ncbi:MAG: hypothetical protein ACON5A_01395 [Candidatus Comchoanobacterales bacterium]
MEICSLAWTREKAVIFYRIKSTLYHSWLLFQSVHHPQWWRSATRARNIQSDLAIIPPLSQCHYHKDGGEFSRWFHVKPILPSWFPAAPFMCFCPLATFFRGIVKQGVQLVSPFELGDGNRSWCIEHNGSDITHVTPSRSTGKKHQHQLYFQSLGGLCYLGDSLSS